MCDPYNELNLPKALLSVKLDSNNAGWWEYIAQQPKQPFATKEFASMNSNNELLGILATSIGFSLNYNKQFRNHTI